MVIALRYAVRSSVFQCSPALFIAKTVLFALPVISFVHAEETTLLIGQPVSPNTLIFFILNISCDLVILCLNKQGKLNSFQSVMSQMSTESLLTISRLKFKLLVHKVELKDSLRNLLNVLLYQPRVEMSHAQ